MGINLSKRETILIVDDNPTNIEVLIGTLNGTGYEIRAATSGEEALRNASLQTPPDLILLDIMMPKMDGFEVCRLLKNDVRTRRIPVIFITARISEEDETKGFKLGAVDYIHKPFGTSIVRARIATHLALANQNRELERHVSEVTKEIDDTRREIIKRLGVAGEFRDNETGAHVIRVGYFVENMALQAGLNEAEAVFLRDASQMHDVGKIGIPDHILLKPGIYTVEERDLMKRHCHIGAQIIGEHTSHLMNLAYNIALRHHEKWDGTGYPDGVSGEDIPYEARLTSIADVFDALISTRPYKNPWSLSSALEYIISETGKSFDPEIVRIFQDSLPELKQIVIDYPEK